MEFLGLTVEQWTDLGGSVLILVVVAVAGRWLVNLLLDRLASRLTRRTSTSLDDTILTAIRPPLYWFLIVLAVKTAINRLNFVPESWDASLGHLSFLLDLAVGFGFAWRLVFSLFAWYGREMAVRTETHLDEQLLPFFRRLALIILGAIGIITLLGHFDIDVRALVPPQGVGS